MLLVINRPAELPVSLKSLVVFRLLRRVRLEPSVHAVECQGRVGDRVEPSPARWSVTVATFLDPGRYTLTIAAGGAFDVIYRLLVREDNRGRPAAEED